MSTVVITASGSRYEFADDGLIYRYSDNDIWGFDGAEPKNAVFVEAINGPKVGQGMVLVAREFAQTVYTTPVVSIDVVDV